MRTLLLLGFVALTAGCQGLLPHSHPVVYEGGDGSSCDQAVVIRNAEFRETGLLAERVWLDKRYPDRRELKESALDLGGRHYDLVELATCDNRIATIYFDTTDWFAK